MKRNGWLWIGGAAAGAIVLVGRRRRRSEPGAAIAASLEEHANAATHLGADLHIPPMPKELGSPIEERGVPRVTPHGYFGAHRDGPPVHSHQGVDLAARAGSHVLAVGDGQIVATEPGLGKVVRKLQLTSPGAYGIGSQPIEAVVYADLGKPLAEPGDRVRKGQPIALIAPAGFVHFAVKRRQGGEEEFFDPKLAGFVYQLPAGMGELS